MLRVMTPGRRSTTIGWSCRSRLVGTRGTSRYRATPSNRIYAGSDFRWTHGPRARQYARSNFPVGAGRFLPVVDRALARRLSDHHEQAASKPTTNDVAFSSDRHPPRPGSLEFWLDSCAAARDLHTPVHRFVISFWRARPARNARLPLK